MSLPTVYFLADTIDTSAQGGEGTGEQLGPDFTAPSFAAATTCAFIFATLFQRPVRLITKYGAGAPWPVIQPGPVNVAMTAVPSGVGW